MNLISKIRVFAIFAMAWIPERGLAQAWPHMDSLVDNFTLPGHFVRIGRTNPVWGTEANGFQLGIETSKDAYGTNEPVHAQVTLTNLSALRGWSRNEYERGGMTSLELVLLHGRELVKSRYLCDRTPGAIGRSSGSVNSLKPGKTAHDGVRLDVQFDMEPNKLYHLYAFRKAFVGDTEIVVTSGTISFIITNGLSVAGGLPSPTDSELTSTAVSQSTPPSSRASNSKQNRASPFAATASPASGAAAGASTPLPTGSVVKDGRPGIATLASSIGFGGWLLIGFPLLVILWVLKRASKRAHRADS